MRLATLKHPTALIPIAMSLAALAVVITYVVTVGTARQADEGAAAHLWQILMAGQLPVIALFAVMWLPRNPRQATFVLALQFVAGLVAAAPVYLLNF